MKVTELVSGEDLAHSIEKVGEAAAQSGTSIHELNGVSTVLIENGLEGSEAGTSIRALLSRTYGLGRDGADGKGIKGLKEYANVDVRDASGEFKSFSKILEETHNAWGNMSKSSQMALAQAIGSTQHYSQFLSIMEQYDSVVKATNTSINSQGSALQENEKYLQSSEGKISQLKVASEKFTNDFISSDTTKGFIDFANGIVTGSDKIVRTFGSLNTIVLDAITVFALFKGKAITEGITSLISYQMALGATTTGEALLAGATSTLSVAFNNLKLAIMNNPLGLIAVGITAVVTAIALWGDSTQNQIDKMDQLSSKMKQQQEDIDSLKGNLTTLDELHSKTNLTNDDKTKLNEINSQLASKYPELISYYDKESKSFQISTEKLDELLKKKQQLAMQENATNLTDAQKTSQQAQKSIDEANEKLASGKKTVKLAKGETMQTDLTSEDRQKLIDSIKENESLVEKSNGVINQSTKFINDYITEQEKMGKAQSTINKELQQYGYTQKEIDDAIKNSISSTSQSNNVTQNNTSEINKNTQAKNDNADATKNQIKSVEELQNQLSSNLESIEKYGGMLNELKDKGTLSSSSKKEILSKEPDLIPYLSDTNKLTEELTKRVTDLKTQSEGAFAVIKVKEENDSLQSLLNTYSDLTSKTSLEQSEKEKLAQVTEELKSRVDGFIETKGKDDQATSSNIALTNDRIGVLQTEEKYLQLVAQVGQKKAEDLMASEILHTQTTYDQVEKRIEAYQKEIQALQAVRNANDNTGMGTDANGNPVFKRTASEARGVQSYYQSELDKLNQVKEAVTEGRKNIGSASKELDGITNNLTADTNSNTKATKENTEAVNEAKQAVKSYENQLKSLDVIMNQIDSSLSHLDEHSDDYINKLKEKQNVIKQEIELNKKAITTNEQYASSLGGLVGSGTGSELTQTVVNGVESLIGTPYVYGGTSPEGFDCSGLVQYVYKQVGISLNRTSEEQFSQGTPVSKADLRPGDLVFFSGSNGSQSSPGHVGVYVGGGEMVESPHRNSVVKESSINRSDYVGARRILTGGVSSTLTSTGYTGTYQSIINEAASNYGVDPNLIAAVIKQESDFNPKSTSGAGAKGLMQLMPGTAKELGVSDPYDVRQSIMGGTKYLKEMIDQFGDVRTAVGHYNSGPAGNLTNSETANYMNKVMGYYQQYSNGSASIPNTSVSGIVSEIEALNGKTQDLQSKNISLQDQYDKINTDILNAKLGQFDDKLAHVDRNKEMAQAKYDISKDNTTESGLEESSKQSAQIWKEINWHYSVLDEKEKYITSQLYSNDYDEKTKSDMLKLLEEVRIQKQQTVKDLHSQFSSWISETYSNSIKPYQNEIEQLQSELDVLDKKSNKNYSEKISINDKILEQEEQIRLKTLEKMKTVQDLIDKEKDPNTLQVWLDQMDILKKDYDQVLQKQIEINNTKIQLVQDSVMKDIQSAIYEGQTQQEYEDEINGQIQALDDELEAIQKKNEALEETETRQKNLLSLAEAQIKLQDEMNNKSVQTLQKDKNGNWQFEYVANQQNVDSLEKEMRDQIKSNSDWEESTSQKHYEESLNDQKEALQQEISIRQEAYSRIQQNLQDAIENNKEGIINGTITISSLISSSFSGITQKYNGKYSSIVSDLKSFINDYTTEITGFNTTLQNALNNIKVVSSGSTSVSSSNISSVSTAINNVKDSLSSIFGKGSSSSGSSSGGSSTGTTSSSSSGDHGLSTSISVSGNTTTYTYADGYKKTVKYKEGGLNTSTGLSWLDGTPSRPEYVLNAEDTSKMFSAIDIIKDINLPSIKDMLSKIPDILPKISLPDLSGLKNLVSSPLQAIEQSVVINADFSGVTNSSEIEKAFNNLLSQGLQYANSNK